MLDIVKKAILDLRDDIETPQFQARIDNPKDYPVLTSPEGKMMTHKMADSGNIAYPMIQLQEDGTLKDYGDDFVGAKESLIQKVKHKSMQGAVTKLKSLNSLVRTHLLQFKVINKLSLNIILNLD